MNTRTSKFIFPAILFLFACLIAFGENGPTPQVIVGSNGIADGSVTNAKMADDSVGADELIDGAVGTAAIATGYNLLTDAEKTQALVGSSTVDFAARGVSANSLYVNGDYFGFKTFSGVIADDSWVTVATITYSALDVFYDQVTVKTTSWSPSVDSGVHNFYGTLYSVGVALASGTFDTAVTSGAGCQIRLEIDGTTAAVQLKRTAAAATGGLYYGGTVEWIHMQTSSGITGGIE